MPPSFPTSRRPLPALLPRAALLPLAAGLPLIAACVGPTASTAPAAAPHAPRAVAAPALVPPPRPAERMGLREATVHREPGLEGVIGATPAELAHLLGTPRLDVYEGDARKLQFTDDACVLDVYLYPPARGAEPRATYVEARRPTGADADRAGCVAAMKARR